MTQNNDIPHIENCLICHQPHLDWEKKFIIEKNIVPCDSYTGLFFIAQCEKCKEYHAWANNIILFLDPNRTTELDNNTPNTVKYFINFSFPIKFSSNNELFKQYETGTFVALMTLCLNIIKGDGKAVWYAAEHLLKLKYPEDDSDKQCDKQSTRNQNINIGNARIKLINLIMQQISK